MTTERSAHVGARGWGMLSAPWLVLLLSCADTHQERRGDRVDVSGYPPDVQAAYPVFAVRCSRCHTLARPLNARIDDPQHWIRYVRRMRRQPGSGINGANADIILRFLLYYHGRHDWPASPTPANTKPARSLPEQAPSKAPAEPTLEPSAQPPSESPTEAPPTAAAPTDLPRPTTGSEP